MVLFALLLAGCSSSRPEKKSARQELGLRGDVKSVTEYSFLYLLDENGQEQLIPQRFELTESPFDFTVEYTRDGQLQERMVLGSDGSPLVINKYQYQDGKQVMVEVYTEGNDSGVSNFVSVFKYNFTV